MAIFNATSLIVEVDSVAVAHATSATLNIDLDTPDASTKSSAGWAEVIAGQRSWSVDVEGLIDYASSFGVEGMFTAINNRASVSLTFTTNVSGDTEYSGTAYATNITHDAPLEDVASWSGSFVGTGALTSATVA